MTFNGRLPWIEQQIQEPTGKLCNPRKGRKQAGTELGQAQVRLDGIIKVEIEVVVKAAVKVEV